MSKKDKLATDPQAVTFAVSDDGNAILTIVFQKQMKGFDPIIKDLKLVRMPCGHFCSYPTAGTGQCCACAKTPACVASMHGFAS